MRYAVITYGFGNNVYSKGFSLYKHIMYVFCRIGYCCHISQEENSISADSGKFCGAGDFVTLVCETQKGTAKFTPFRVKAAGRHRNAFLKREWPIEFRFAWRS